MPRTVFDVRYLLLDEPHAFDSLDRAPDIILIAGRAGKDQRVKDDVFRAYAVIFGEQFVRAAGDLKLSLARYGLRLLFVFVDAADDQRRAVFARERGDELEFFEPVFEVDRVDDRFALAVGERALDGHGVRGVDHDRRFDQPYHAIVETVYVIQLVAVGVLEIDVADLRAAFHLLARYLCRLFVFLFGDKAFELARAYFVGPLADDERALVVARLDKIYARKESPVMLLVNARALAFDHLGELAYVRRGSPATAAHEIYPAVIDESLERRGQAFGRFEIDAVFVRQPRVRYAGDARLGQRGDDADVIGHELRPGRAVQTYRKQVGVHQRSDESFDGLTRQHRARRLDRARNHHRHFEPDLIKQAPLMPISAALTLRVSCCVSTIRMSAPPATSPAAWS